MGKAKKPARNPYFFFIMEKKQEREAEGYRFMNFADASKEFGHLWAKLPKEQRKRYEDMSKESKEKEKYNDTNKYTVTGESYAQVHMKALDLQTTTQQMEEFIRRLTKGPSGSSRNFVFMKVIHCVEEIKDRTKRIYWPCEISLAVFSLKDGLKAVYTQLIDVGTPPCGYASEAKDVCEETGLPMPGDKKWFREEHRDYQRIMKNINGFANHWLQDGYNIPGHRKVFFALNSEIEPIKSGLQWMVDRLPIRSRDKYQHFVDHLKVYKISNLVLSLALEANRVNPSYNNHLVQHQLHSAAEQIVTRGNYDYREEIACAFHRTDQGGMKMHNCAQSIVMRRVFMLFEEFVSAFKFDLQDRHQINKLNKKNRAPGPAIKKKRDKEPEEDVAKPKTAFPDWLNDSDDEDVNGSRGASEFTSNTKRKVDYIDDDGLKQSPYVKRAKIDAFATAEKSTNQFRYANDALKSGPAAASLAPSPAPSSSSSSHQSQSSSVWGKQPSDVPPIYSKDNDFPTLGAPSSSNPTTKKPQSYRSDARSPFMGNEGFPELGAAGGSRRPSKPQSQQRSDARPSFMGNDEDDDDGFPALGATRKPPSPPTIMHRNPDPRLNRGRSGHQEAQAPPASAPAPSAAKGFMGDSDDEDYRPQNVQIGRGRGRAAPSLAPAAPAPRQQKGFMGDDDDEDDFPPLGAPAGRGRGGGRGRGW